MLCYCMRLVTKTYLRELTISACACDVLPVQVKSKRSADTLTYKLTCALSLHRLGVIARAGGRGSRARNAEQTLSPPPS